MKEILLKVQEHYLEEVRLKKANPTFTLSGLCYSGRECLSWEGEIKFSSYLAESVKKKKVFYEFDGDKTPRRKHSYYWKPSNTKARLKWLDKHIKALKS